MRGGPWRFAVLRGHVFLAVSDLLGFLAGFLAACADVASCVDDMEL